MYIRIKVKFAIISVASILFFIFQVWFLSPWVIDLSKVFGLALSILIIGGIAIGPGLLNFFLILSMFFDNQKDIYTLEKHNPDVSILIAAYNEEKSIYETLLSLSNQKYDGTMYVYVIDNNSSDNTKYEILKGIMDFNRSDLVIKYIFEPKQGKFNALNNALERVTTEYVITVDADSWVYRDAISNLVSRMVNDDCVSVAGATLARNSRDNLLTKMQEWDYFLSIASVKKMQGLFQGTLVAQGAFSIYDTELIKKYGGWEDCIGEDIVITWNLLHEGYKVYYEPKAIVFTIVPTEFRVLFIQRMRWARGMIEGFRRFKPWDFTKNKYVIFLTLIDFAIVYFDFSFVFFFLPGVVAAFFGYYYIVGIFTLFTLPLNLVCFSILLIHENNVAFKPMGLKIRKNYTGYFFFLLIYQVLMSPAALIGYYNEFLKKKRKWK